MAGIAFRPAEKADAPLLVRLYDASFYEDFVRYGACPGYGRSVGQMEASIARFTKYIILFGGTPVGALSFERRAGGEVYLGCLCVIPAYQGRGVGTRAFQYLLSVCPGWKRITLVTPADKAQNLRFYTEKCGCSVAETAMDGAVAVVTLVRER